MARAPWAQAKGHCGGRDWCVLSVSEAVPEFPSFIERIVDPTRWIPAVVELAVWFAVPTVLVLVLVGVGSAVVRAGPDLLGVVHSATAGALILVSAVTLVNLLMPVPKSVSLVVIPMGLWAFVRSVRRDGSRGDVLLLVAVLAAGSALYRLRMGSTVGYDVFLYHGPVLEWMAREPLPQGLGLFHGRFGFSNGLLLLMGALRSPFGDWSHHALVEAAVVALGFAVLMACFQLARRTGDRWLASFASGAALVSAIALASSFHEPGNDLAVTFTLLGATAVAGLAARATQEDGPRILAALVTMVAFAFAQKSSAAAAVVLLLVLLKMRPSLSTTVELLRRGGVSIALAVVTVALITTRTFVATGCLVYPFGPSCWDVPWGVGRAATSDESQGIRAWARNSGAGPQTSATDFSWLTDWFAYYVTTTPARIIIGAFVIWSVAALRARSAARDRWRGVIVGYLVVGGLVWFVSAPAPRFALHLHLAVAAALLARPIARFLESPLSDARLRRDRARIASALLVAAGVVVTGQLVHAGRTLPFTSSTSADAAEPLVTHSLDAQGTPGGSWEYLVRVGGDQCGAAFPCAPAVIRQDLLVDSSSFRLRFLRVSEEGD